MVSISQTPLSCKQTNTRRQIQLLRELDQREQQKPLWSLEISSVIKQLSTLKTNKSTGLDRISTRLLKDAATVIAPTLTEIFNHLLKSSTFPQIWKDGKLTPIFKCGDCSNMSNYRPITVLPILSKILECFVHTQICNHLSENNILSPQQFGFRPKLSTSTALAFFTDHIFDNANNGLLTASVFLDFSKAFDTVDLAILLRKLKSVGLTDLNYWIKLLSCKLKPMAAILDYLI